MEINKTKKQEGDLYISANVIEKIAKLAALEIDGVSRVSIANFGVKGMFAKTNLPKAVEVSILEGVADIKINIVLEYGFKVKAVAKLVQEAIKTSVQNMTNITVAKVNIIISGVDTIENIE